MRVSITMGSVATSKTVNGKNAGQKFAKSKAIAHFSNGDKEVTVMAFGAQRENVLGALRKGRRNDFTAVWDGKNVLKLLDMASEVPAEGAEAAAA